MQSSLFIRYVNKSVKVYKIYSQCTKKKFCGEGGAGGAKETPKNI